MEMSDHMRFTQVSWNVSRAGLHVMIMNKGGNIQKLQNSSFPSTKCCDLSPEWNLAGKSNSFHLLKYLKHLKSTMQTISAYTAYQKKRFPASDSYNVCLL